MSERLETTEVEPGQSCEKKDIRTKPLHADSHLTRELYWSDFLERQSISGLTIKEFCLREGVSSRSFYTWRLRLRSRDSSDKSKRGSTDFVELIPGVPDSGVQVEIGSKFRVIVARGFDEETLRSTLRLASECAQCYR